MAYAELLRALEQEVREEARALAERSRQERERAIGDAERAAVSAREDALAGLRAELAEARLRRATAGEREQEREILDWQRRLLEDLRAEVASRLADARGLELTLRLLDEALAEAGPGAILVEVDPGEEEAVREHMVQRHPAAAARAAFRCAPAPRGGIRLEVAERTVLDNTLPARLARAWTVLEGRAAELLFGGENGAL